jgi:hypothetical protein
MKTKIRIVCIYNGEHYYGGSLTLEEWEIETKTKIENYDDLSTWFYNNCIGNLDRFYFRLASGDRIFFNNKSHNNCVFILEKIIY